MEEDIKILEEMKQNCLTKREYVDPKAERKAQALENIIKGYREKEESEKYLYDAYQDAGKKMFEYAEQLENSIPKSKIKEKIEEQLEEANDVLEKGNYLDNFNGNKSEQKYYYEGYKDATIFISELMEDK